MCPQEASIVYRWAPNSPVRVLVYRQLHPELLLPWEPNPLLWASMAQKMVSSYSLEAGTTKIFYGYDVCKIFVYGQQVILQVLSLGIVVNQIIK